MGRPSDYTEETASAICDRLSTGESLTKICGDDDMPAKTTVLRWLAQQEAFRTQYAHAKELSQEAIAEEYFEILDAMPPAKPDGSFDAAAVAWAKNRADARKWYLSKIAAKKYGDRQAIDVTDITPKTPEQVNTRIAELLALAQAKPEES